MKLCRLWSEVFLAKAQLFLSVLVGCGNLLSGEYDKAFFHFIIAFWAGQYAALGEK